MDLLGGHHAAEGSDDVAVIEHRGRQPGTVDEVVCVCDADGVRVDLGGDAGVPTYGTGNVIVAGKADVAAVDRVLRCPVVHRRCEPPGCLHDVLKPRPGRVQRGKCGDVPVGVIVVVGDDDEPGVTDDCLRPGVDEPGHHVGASA